MAMGAIARIGAGVFVYARRDTVWLGPGLTLGLSTFPHGSQQGELLAAIEPPRGDLLLALLPHVNALQHIERALVHQPTALSPLEDAT